MSEQVRKPLPESLMQAIRATIADDSISLGDRFEAALLIAHGYGLWEQTPTVDPTLFAIPEPQWTEISARLMNMDRGASDVGRVNAALGWMNSGPSAYKPEGGEGSGSRSEARVSDRP